MKNFMPENYKISTVDMAKEETSAHGDDLYKYPGQIRANFSSNVWPGGMQNQLRDQIISSLASIGSYPPPHGESMNGLLADWLNVAQGGVMLTNGTAEAIFLIAQAYSGSVSRIVIPTFSEYERACALFGHQLQYIQEDELTGDEMFADGLCWICNPNNPTGKIHQHETLIRLVSQNPHCLFVIDEAYQGLATGVDSLISSTLKFDNLLVLCSLTKTYVVPGIRVGYLVGNGRLISSMAMFQPPWSVNVMALKVVEFAVYNRPFTKDQLEEYLMSSQQLQYEIDQIKGFEVVGSKMGYFLVKTLWNATELKQHLVSESGILVRDASTFRGLSSNYIRIATQDKSKNKILVEGLKKK